MGLNVSIKVNFDHLLVVVKDFEKSVKFYQLLGFKLLDTIDRPNDTVSVMELGGFRIEMMYIKEGKATEGHSRKETDMGFRHIGLKVDDVMDVYKKLEKSIKFDSEPKPIQNRPGRLTVFFKDPNGIEMHFVQS